MVKHPGKILIVDDDSRNTFALTDRQDVGIILLEIMMPVMDGYEVIPKIKEDEHAAGIPIIAVTARAQCHLVKGFHPFEHRTLSIEH